jgi:hypothetical protein
MTDCRLSPKSPMDLRLVFVLYPIFSLEKMPLLELHLDRCKSANARTPFIAFFTQVTPFRT